MINSRIKKQTKRVAIYSRTSTKRQVKKDSIKTQLVQLRQFVSTHRYKIVKEYSDRGYSGMRSDRPEFKRLMNDAEQGLFDAVVCWKFDRFARDVSEF